MTIAVTGANGQLGNEMRVASSGSSLDILFTDIDQLDITSYDAVADYIRANGVEVVVNCAAYTAVDRAEEDAETADKINHKAVANLAKACAECDAALIHISTDYVFAGDASTPYTEESPTSPLGVYGRTKLDGERAILDSGCRAVIVRTAWLYSEYGNNFCKTMRALTATKPSIRVVNDQIGSPTYALDLAKAIMRIIEQGIPTTPQIFHFTNEGVCSWYDFAVEIARLSGNNLCTITPCSSEEYPTKARRPHYSVLNKSKIKRTYNLEIEDWKGALARCINTIKSQE